jgi:hypothetical protein
MITKTFFLAKDLNRIGALSLREKISLRDHDLADIRQDETGAPVSMIIEFRGWSLFRAEHLRLLAGILAERTWRPGGTEEKARQVVTFLSQLAERIDRDNQWGFRAGPMADRRESPGQYT